MGKWRIGLAVAGFLAVSYGLLRFITDVPFAVYPLVILWMAFAIAIHDGLLSPFVLGVATLLKRVPDRARRYLQFGLIVGGILTLMAIPLIYRRGSEPVVKAILLQNYGANLALALGIVAGVTLIAYAVKVARDHGTATAEPAE